MFSNTAPPNCAPSIFKSLRLASVIDMLLIFTSLNVESESMTRFAVINPHVRWFFVETKPDGTKVEWEMSGAGPGALRAAGLMRIFKVGEQYEVTFAPVKSGANVGRVRTMKGPDGKVITLFHEDPTNPLNQ